MTDTPSEKAEALPELTFDALGDGFMLFLVPPERLQGLPLVRANEAHLARVLRALSPEALSRVMRGLAERLVSGDVVSGLGAGAHPGDERRYVGRFARMHSHNEAVVLELGGLRRELFLRASSLQHVSQPAERCPECPTCKDTGHVISRRSISGFTTCPECLGLSSLKRSTGQQSPAQPQGETTMSAGSYKGEVESDD